jgi:hypothetical protein
MKLSDTTNDFEYIHEQHHVSSITELLKKTVPNYFKKITDSKLADKSGGFSTPSFVWNRILLDGVEKYEKESPTYKEFFSEDSMDEFEEIDDPKVFKSDLRKDCPIIHKTLFSKMEELQEWKEDFARANPQELFDTFANFLDFMHVYVENVEDRNYNDLMDYEDFKELQKFSDDEDLTLRNVIGAGIKTTVLYHIFPQHFLKSVRRTLYGLYFLTDDLHNRMPSKTSEFIMIDDKDEFRKNGRGSRSNFKMDHNYWYPYNLFMLYANHVRLLLEKELKSIGVKLSPDYRFVHVNTFLEELCKLNSDSISTMMGTDQDY